ncbi:cation:proton antiporter domain-containing protein [unidentified bacterial endosymbiont]|uniref:cation:proton antiporter domain-containing protein n=1 Tax=unidentified bacterial endosymbiont TaxID=2355 RepID=UPI0020A19208|nr:cation:proton antiporter [unidentified bacterial endosymbiont]
MLDSSLLLVLSVAFASGFIIQRIGLPPLVGFLLAGFGLRSCGIHSFHLLEELSEFGVTILLFTIGLKLNARLLVRREVWLSSTGYGLLSVVTITLCMALFSVLKFPGLSQLNWSQWGLLAVALSFSSTVLAVKALQVKGEISSTYGRLSLSILVIQDLLAVLFLTLMTGELPSYWVGTLFLLPLARPLFFRFLSALGHDEILVLGGITLALIPGAALFHFCGLNAHLGALVIGLLLAPHARASELSKSLFGIKELFLVSFFVQIGLAESPNWQSLNIALLLLLLLPVKGILYYIVVRSFRFRVRSSLQTAITLCNFSEFGLIVGNIAVKQGLLDNQWLLVLALTTALSFLVAAPINQLTDRFYVLLAHWGARDHNDRLRPEDQLIDTGPAQVLILGMGRIGASTYDELRHRYGEMILGVELTADSIPRHNDLGRNVIVGDAADPDFWQQLIPQSNIRLILLAMPRWRGTQFVLQQLQRQAFKGRIAAIAQFEDEMLPLQESGIDASFNVYSEAGCGFARHVITTLNTDQLLLDHPRAASSSPTD